MVHVLSDCYDAYGMPFGDRLLKNFVPIIKSLEIKKSFTYTKRPYEIYCSADIVGDLINFIELTMNVRDVMAFESRAEKGWMRINQPLSEEETKDVERFYLTLVG